jgi:hypothetical protein
MQVAGRLPCVRSFGLGSRPLGALGFAVLGVDEVGVAGTFVACVLAGAGGDAVALATADIAVLIAHLVLPIVLCATSLARGWAICTTEISDRVQMHIVNMSSS